MGFFDDAFDVLKDVGTSATRIVTDTAIDLGDVATGFQFSDEMDAAKKKMSEAGVLSAADAIEKNHYAFLKDMEKEVKAKYETITRLYKDGQSAEIKRDQRADDLAEMLQDADVLSQMSTAAQQLLKQAQAIPDWQKWAVILDMPESSLLTLDTTISEWHSIGEKIALTNVGASAASGAAGLVGLSVLAKASKGLKASKLSSTVSKGSKFLRVGKIASRASAVLAIVTVGLDIGLSVVELEKRKDALEKNIKELNSGIAEANRDITSIREETRRIEFRIYELLNSVTPSQTESTWDSWVDKTKNELTQSRERLTNFSSIRTKAIQVAQLTKGQPLKDRIDLIASIDLEISVEEAKDIINQVDSNRLDSTVVTIPLPAASNKVKNLTWQITGPGSTEILPDASADQMICKYSLSGPSTWTRQTWTYYAKAKTTKTLSFSWRYTGFHAWFKPFLQVSAFADGPAGRRYITLLEGATREGQGTAEIVINQNETFGFVIKGSNYDRDARLLGELTLQFNA